MTPSSLGKIKEAAARQRAEWDNEQANKQFVEWLTQGEQEMRYKVEHKGSIDATPVVALDVGNIEIVIDDQYTDRVELYILDSEGTRIEGGTFSKDAFMSHVRRFYDANL